MSIIQRIIQHKYYHFTQYSLYLTASFLLGFSCLNSQVSSLLPKLPVIQGSCSEKGGVYCYGVNTIYIVSLALSIFYLIQLSILLKFKKYYLGYYSIRWIMFLGLLAALAWIPSLIIKVYAWMAMFSASIFMLMIVIIWVDFANQWQQQQLHLMQPHRSKINQIWIIIFDICSFFLILVNLSLSVVSLIFFDCMTGLLINAVNLILGLFSYCLPFRFKNVTMFPIAIIVLYNTYVTYGGLNYGIGLTSSCYYHNRTLSNFDSPVNFTTIFDTFLTLVSLIWTCISIANSHYIFTLSKDYSQNIFNSERLLNNSVYDQETGVEHTINIVDEYGSINEIDINEDENDAINNKRYKQFRFFFIVMTLSSSYLLATLSSWQIYGHSLKSRIDSGITSMYIKIVSTYVCYLLYYWVLYYNNK